MLAYVSPGGGSLRPFLHRLRGVKVGKSVWIGQYVWIDALHPEAVIISDNCTIGHRTSIMAHTLGHQGEVLIEDSVFIGPQCVILPNVRIGRGAVVKAGTVVTRNVPPATLWGPPAAGPLARVTVPLIQAHTYEEFVSGLRPIRRGRARKPGDSTATDATQDKTDPPADGQEA